MKLNSDLAVAAIIVARTDSTRLPGKIMEIVAGRPIVDYVIDRALRIPGVDTVALATTDRDIDDRLVEHARSRGLAVFRGETQDVAGRVLACADSLGADYIIRVNGDSPFLDPALIGEAMGMLSSGCDLVTNIVGRTFPYGVSVEIIRTEALRRAHSAMTDSEREHVTLYFYANADEFKVCGITSNAPDLRTVRLAVDTWEDLEVFREVVLELGVDVSTANYERVAAVYRELGYTD